MIDFFYVLLIFLTLREILSFYGQVKIDRQRKEEIDLHLQKTLDVQEHAVSILEDNAERMDRLSGDFRVLIQVMQKDAKQHEDICKTLNNLPFHWRQSLMRIATEAMAQNRQKESEKTTEGK